MFREFKLFIWVYIVRMVSCEVRVRRRVSLEF